MKSLAGVLLLAGGAFTMGQEPERTPPTELKEVHLHPPPGKKFTPTDKVTPAKLIKKINPAYPPLARQTRISGTVKLRAVIGADGSVQQLDLISGHPLLVKPALDAVWQWKYTPVLVDGEPVEIDTTIDVVFSLKQDPPKPEEKPSATK